MTSVLIIGGGGMIGQKLASSFSTNDSLTLLDIGFPNKNQSNAFDWFLLGKPISSSVRESFVEKDEASF